MELNPDAVLRAHKEKNLPQKAPVMLLNCLFQLPSLELSFPLLLSAENGIFHDHHSELCSPRPSLGCTLVTSVALEPGVGPVISWLPIWLLSVINCFNYTLQGCFIQIRRQDFLCMFLLLLPCLPLCPLPPAPGHLRSSFLFLVVYI